MILCRYCSTHLTEVYQTMVFIREFDPRDIGYCVLRCDECQHMNIIMGYQYTARYLTVEQIREKYNLVVLIGCYGDIEIRERNGDITKASRE